MNLLEAVKYTAKIRSKQYKTGKVGALDFKYLLKEYQFYVTAQARSSDGSRIYKTQIVFKGIRANDIGSDEFPMPYSKNDKDTIYLNQPKVETNIMMRCQCPDYYFMFQYWNKKDKALVGPNKQYVPVSPPSGRPPVNPTESPGMCKHLLGMTKTLMENKILKRDSTVWSYINQSPRIKE